MFTFNESNYKISEEYQRMGKACLFDPIREILIPANPEERVRQKVLIWLMKDLKVPNDAITSEDHLSHYKKGEHDRADIVVKASKNKTLLLVECKEPNVSLTHDILERQVYKYTEILRPKYIMLTNGIHSIYQVFRDGAFRDLKGLLDYEGMLKEEGLKFDLSFFEYSKPIVNTKYKLFLHYKKDSQIVSKYMSPQLANFTANLYNCLMNELEKIKSHQFNGLKIIKDGGLRYASFGNAAGGKFDGYYRYFIVKDKESNNQLISFTISTTAELENDPVWGNQKEKSYLCVAIDDFKIKHNSIQLNMNKYIEQNGDNFTLWHDGRIAIGNIGSAKSQEVLEYVKGIYPELLKNGRIELGTLNNEKLLHINDKEVTQFIINCIKYVIARDKFRALKKSEKIIIT